MPILRLLLLSAALGLVCSQCTGTTCSLCTGNPGQCGWCASGLVAESVGTCQPAGSTIGACSGGTAAALVLSYGGVGQSSNAFCPNGAQGASCAFFTSCSSCTGGGLCHWAYNLAAGMGSPGVCTPKNDTYWALDNTTYHAWVAPTDCPPNDSPTPTPSERPQGGDKSPTPSPSSGASTRPQESASPRTGGGDKSPEPTPSSGASTQPRESASPLNPNGGGAGDKSPTPSGKGSVPPTRESPSPFPNGSGAGDKSPTPARDASVPPTRESPSPFPNDGGDTGNRPSPSPTCDPKLPAEKGGCGAANTSPAASRPPTPSVAKTPNPTPSVARSPTPTPSVTPSAFPTRSAYPSLPGKSASPSAPRSPPPGALPSPSPPPTASSNANATFTFSGASINASSLADRNWLCAMQATLSGLFEEALASGGNADVDVHVAIRSIIDAARKIRFYINGFDDVDPCANFVAPLGDGGRNTTAGKRLLGLAAPPPAAAAAAAAAAVRGGGSIRALQSSTAGVCVSANDPAFTCTPLTPAEQATYALSGASGVILDIGVGTTAAIPDSATAADASASLAAALTAADALVVAQVSDGALNDAVAHQAGVPTSAISASAVVSAPAITTTAAPAKAASDASSASSSIPIEIIAGAAAAVVVIGALLGVGYWRYGACRSTASAPGAAQQATFSKTPLASSTTRPLDLAALGTGVATMSVTNPYLNGGAGSGGASARSLFGPQTAGGGGR